MEPIDAVCRVPSGGWPKALLRLELLADLKFNEAVYEVACASRLERRGVVATYDGNILAAWPHQEIHEIRDTYYRMRDNRVEVADPNIRWTASRKEWVCIGIVNETMTRAEAMDNFAIAGDELDSWMMRYSRHGQDGLKALVVRA